MCTSNAKASPGVAVDITPSAVARINGRVVLQPTCNRVPSLDRRNSLKKMTPKSPPAPPPPPPPPLQKLSAKNTKPTSPISPKSKSPRPPAIKRGNDINSLNLSAEKLMTLPRKTPTLERKKSKKISENASSIGVSPSAESLFSYSSSLIVEAPGSIAAERREQMALLQAQRKMRIAHYGRSKSAKFSFETSSSVMAESTSGEEKRCSFITPNSDPLYVAYHDKEWGVPVHDDKILFELLVLSGAQVGSDWISTLKKRQDLRNAFSGFDAEIVANFTERQMLSVSTNYGIELSRVRGVVDNSNRILQIKKEFGSFDNYIWGFVNHKPISTQYKSCLKIPVKTSKSETISKDMVRRGFRSVGPTIVHSFMQAAGLTNDHLITCHRHIQCTALADHRPPVAPCSIESNDN